MPSQTDSAPEDAAGPIGANPRRTDPRVADSARVLGQINDRVALELFLEHGALTRTEIGELTGLSKPTVSALIGRLVARRLVIDAGAVTGSPGPRSRRFAINGSAAHLIAIQVETGGCRAALVDLAGTELCVRHFPHTRRRGDDPRVEIGTIVAELRRSTQEPGIGQIAIASPGVIDPTTGTLRHARHLEGWQLPELRSRLSEHLGIPVAHGNDVNLATVAEGSRGAGVGQRDFALLWLDRGVGLGLVLGGSLRTGAHGGAGEIGYLPIPGAQPRVDRGAPGAFQLLVGSVGIEQLRRECGLPKGDAAAVITAAVRAAAEDPLAEDPLTERPLAEAAHHFLDELADRLALGIASITAIADPAVVVLGGPHAEAGGPLLRRLISARLPRHAFVRVPIELSALGTDAILSGAVEVGLQELRQRLFAE